MNKMEINGLIQSRRTSASAAQDGFPFSFPPSLSPFLPPHLTGACIEGERDATQAHPLLSPMKLSRSPRHWSLQQEGGRRGGGGRGSPASPPSAMAISEEPVG